MDLTLIIPAFLAGLITFLAPCTLPLVPGYLGFISGTSVDDLNDPAKKEQVKKKILKNGIFFVLGFSVVFILFGTLAGLLGQALVPYRIWLTRIGGVFIIIFGLFMVGVLKLPFLSHEKRLKLPSFLTLGKPSSSFIVGNAFAFGWTPCVGPILASILLLASSSSTALQGAILLAVFSLGLAVPFLLVALGTGHAAQYINKISKYLNVVSIIGGAFLILLGILLLANKFTLLLSWGFKLFSFFGYERIVDYL
ncbi:MAG: cytochrome C biogenesis protein [Parcubacteria group bacterium]|nr:cytochrome C biogenesis protein [Parcubacteria group bacterium]|tara:strand:- start:9183 stop:9938 length:756 start_codon:yes stop_codon:yes gene_type:complete